MPCKLGLGNPDMRGGTYKGKGVASVVRWSRENMQIDGFLGEYNVMRPDVYFEYSEGWKEETGNGACVPVGTMMDSDEYFEGIFCKGFGTEKNEQERSCRDCPYVRTSNEKTDTDVFSMSISRAFKKESNVYPIAVRTLSKAGIERVDQLIGHTRDELLGLNGLGKSTVRYIKRELQRYGLALSPSASD